MLDYIRNKMIELQNLVDTNLAQEANQQKVAYNSKAQHHAFKVEILSARLEIEDLVWLNILNAGKVEPRWEGKWMIKSIKSPVTMEITDGCRTTVAHVNELNHHFQRKPIVTRTTEAEPPQQDWIPLQIDQSPCTDEPLTTVKPCQ